MRYSLFILLFITSKALWAQHDSIAIKSKVELLNDSIKASKLDSLRKANPVGKASNKLDSIERDAQYRLGSFNSKLDSISGNTPLNKLENKVDSISSLGQSGVNRINQKVSQVQYGIRNELDSLQNGVTNKLSPVTNQVDQTFQKVNSGVESIQDKAVSETREKLNEVDKLKLESLDRELSVSGLDNELKGLDKDIIPGANLKTEIPKAEIDIPETNLDGSKFNVDQPNLNVPGMEGSSPSINPGNSERLKLSDVSVPGTEKVTDNLQKLEVIKTESGKIANEVKGIRQDGLRSANTDELEKKAFELSGVGEMDNKMKEFNKLKLEQELMMQKYHDKKLIEAELKRKMKNVVNEELSTKSPVIKKAQASMSKIQKVKPAVGTVKEATRIHRNEMKGKPAKERLVPGVALQVFKGNYFSLDISTQLGFRLSGRLTSGLGVQYRLDFNKNFNYYVQGAGVYGGRSYLDFKAFKSFYLHAEFEALKLETRAIPAILIEETPRIVYSSHFGIGKQFNVSKKISAMMLGFYRLEYSGRVPGATKYNARLVFNLRNQKKKPVSETK